MIIKQEAIQLFHFSFSPHNTSFEKRTDELVTRLSVLSALGGFQGFEKSEHAKNRELKPVRGFCVGITYFPVQSPAKYFRRKRA